MPDFQIKISTPADLAGSKAAAASLEGQIEACKILGKSYDDLQAKLLAHQQAQVAAELAGIKMGDSVAESGSKAAAAGEGFKIFGRGAHEAHGILESLNQAFPGLQTLSRFMMTGFTASLGVVVIAFEYLKGKIEEVNKALDDLTYSGERGEWAEDIRKQSVESGIEIARFTEEINRLATAQANLSEITDRMIARQKAQASDQDAIAQEARQLREAQLAIAEKIGAVTPEQAIKIKLEIDEEAFTAELDAKVAGIQAELAARTQELAKNSARADALKGNVTRADEAKQDADDAKTLNEQKLAQARANLEKTQRLEEDNQKRIDEIGFEGRGKQILDQGELIIRQRASSENQSLIGGYNAEVYRAQNRETPLGEDAAKAADALNEAKDKLREGATLNSDLEKQIADLNAQLADQKAQSRVMEKAHNDTARTKAALSSPEQLADIQAQQNWAQTPAAGIDTARARAALGIIRSHIVTGQAGDQDLRDMFNEFIGLAEDLHATSVQKQEFSELARDVDRLRMQISNRR